jgi:serine/threonine protein kinase
MQNTKETSSNNNNSNSNSNDNVQALSPGATLKSSNKNPSSDGRDKRGNIGADGGQSPPRVLTKNETKNSINDFDNTESDLILITKDVLLSSGKYNYEILSFLGSGTFGQVVKCKRILSNNVKLRVDPVFPTPEVNNANEDAQMSISATDKEKNEEYVAVKVVKSKEAYFRQALTEIRILKFVKEKVGVSTDGNLVEMYDYFKYKEHLCIAFEMLGENLYELLKNNQFRGLPTKSVRVYLKQIINGCKALNDAKIIHCDLKPENILIVGPKEDLRIKIIDLGSACFEGQTVYSYIQSRFYRAPEVLLRLAYDSAIDIWSIGCIAAELFLGLPLFPGVSEHSQLSRIIDMFETYPPDHMLRRGRGTSKFFKPRKSCVYSPPVSPHSNSNSPSNQRKRKLLSSKARYSMKRAPADTLLQFKTPEEYAKDLHRDVDEYKTYFRYARLHDIIMYYPMSQVDANKEREDRLSFINLLNGLLNMDHTERWTSEQAMQHPFITGEKMAPGGYKPPSDQMLERRRQDMCAELKTLRLVDDSSSRAINQKNRSKTNNSGGKHIRGVSDEVTSYNYTRPVKIRKNSRRGSLESALNKHNKNIDAADNANIKGTSKGAATIPVLPATDLTPPKKRVSQLSLQVNNPNYNINSFNNVGNSSKNLKAMEKGSDDFASQATISSGFLGTSLPSSQSYMKALGTGKLGSGAGKMVVSTGSSNYNSTNASLSSSYPYGFQMNERLNLATEQQEQQQRVQPQSDGMFNMNIENVRIDDYDLEGGAANSSAQSNDLLTPQRMRRAQLAVGELHQPIQNSGRPFQFLPYQQSDGSGFKNNDALGKLSSGNRGFKFQDSKLGSTNNGGIGNIDSNTNKISGLSSSFGGWASGNFTGAQSWGGVSGGAFIQPPTFQHGQSKRNQEAPANLGQGDNNTSQTDGGLPIKKHQSLLSGMLEENNIQTTSSGLNNNGGSNSSFSNGMFNFYGHVGSAPAASQQYLPNFSPTSRDDGNNSNNPFAFGGGNQRQDLSKAPISPHLSPRGQFLGETSPLYEEDDDQFDLEMDMGFGSSNDDNFSSGNRPASDSLGTAKGIPIPIKKKNEDGK